jgi:hypothetical protein
MKKAKMLSKLKKMTGPTRLPVEEKPVLMKGQIAANVLNIRAKASTDSDVVGKLKKNDIVEIIGIGEQWYEIHHNDGNAFVFAKFVEPLLKTGRVNANKLNIRSLPNLDAEKLGLLTADKKIIIVDEIDGWYKIKYKESFGYVFGKFIEITADKPGKTFLFQDPQLLTIPIEPAKKVEVTGNRIQQIVREAYNKYGNLLSHLSNKLGLELAASVAVLSVESGGVGIEKGRALIRFENHLFYKYWGKFNEAKYRQHFQFASGKNWLGHKFRKDPDGEWIDFHGDQDKEYEALNFARSLDDEKALLSISMGLPQILGSNSKLIGYDSVQEMFENFNKDIRYHIFALFDFFSPRMIKYLKGREFVNFAKYYNGQGQARRYGKFIQDYYEAFPKNLG